MFSQLFRFCCREREEQIQRLSEVQKQQAQQAEHALEDFKSQVERNSGRMFDEMKAQVLLPLTSHLTDKVLISMFSGSV